MSIAADMVMLGKTSPDPLKWIAVGARRMIPSVSGGKLAAPMWWEAFNRSKCRFPMRSPVGRRSATWAGRSRTCAAAP